MVKVGIITNSVVLSKTIGILLISRGYYVNHIFPYQQNSLENYDVFVVDFDGIKTLTPNELEKVLSDVLEHKKFTILITSEKSPQKLKEFLQKGVNGVVDSKISPLNLAEQVYELLQTFPIQDDDKRKHYRVKIEYGTLRVEITPGKIIEGTINDISAGGVSAYFKSEEESNMFINNKAYPCEIIFGNIVIRTKIFLLRRDSLFCGFKFFGIDERQLIKLSEFIYHHIIESNYNILKQQ